MAPSRARQAKKDYVQKRLTSVPLLETIKAVFSME
jgi:hypothetical protein